MDTTVTVQEVLITVKVILEVHRHQLKEVFQMLVVLLQVSVEVPQQEATFHRKVKLATNAKILQQVLPTVHRTITQAVHLEAAIPMLIQQILLAILLQETIFHLLKTRQGIQVINPHRTIS